MGEIGKTDFDEVVLFLEKALNDNSNKAKSSIMGSLKKWGGENPEPTLSLAKKFINHPDPEIRRLIVHGIEITLEEIWPLLYKLRDS